MKIFLINIGLLISLACHGQAPALMIPKGHSGTITHLATSPDNKWLATGDDKGTVKLWDLPTAREIKTIVINSDTYGINDVSGLNFSADSKKLYRAHGYNLIINDLSDAGKEIFNKKANENFITQILISPNGKILATVGNDELKIWNTENMALVKDVTIKGKNPKLAFDGANNIVVISTGNYTEVTASFDFNDIVTNIGYITRINSATGQVIATDEFENLPDDYMYISPNAKFLFLTRSNKVTSSILVTDIDSKKVIKSINGVQGKSISLLTFSADNRYMVDKAGESISFYDLSTFENIKTFTGENVYTKAMLLGRDGNKLFQPVQSNGTIVQWNVPEKKIEKTFGGEANYVHDLEIIPSQQTLTMLYGSSLYYGKKFYLQKFDLKNAALSKMSYPNLENNLQKYKIASAGGGRLLESNIASSLDRIIDGKHGTSFAVSNDNKILVTTNQYESQSKLYLYNVADGNQINTFSLAHSAYTLLFSKDDKAIYVGYGQANKIEKIDLNTGEVLNVFTHTDDYSKNKKITELLLSKDESRLIGVNDVNEMYSWNTATTQEIQLNLLNYKKGSSIKAMPGANAFVYGDMEFNINMYDLTENKVVRTIKLDSKTTNALELTDNGNFLFYSNTDKSVSLWDFKKGVLLATLVFFGETDWVIVDKTGRFDGTPEAMKKMYYVKGLEYIPLESAFEKFFTPGLLQTLLAGEKIAPPPIDINTLKAAPVVKIGYTEAGRNLLVEDDTPEYKTINGQAKIDVNATCTADAVTEIRLYQNGKLVGGTRNLVVEDDVIASPKMTKTFMVNLLPGVNTFKAIALNTQRTESKPVIISVNYSPSQNDVTVSSNITLHMLVIGINTYKNPKYNLNYAQADAEAFKNTITKGSESLFSKTDVVYLSNEQATQTGITQALDKIKTEAKPQDLFIFYYAGHGVINDKKDFYLVPFDVTQLYGNDDALAQKGFSAAALQQWSKDIKAQKQLFILDACQSAGALQTVSGSRGAAEEKAIAQLARSTGTQWLTASGSEQFASEFASLGHGSFTYCILQALGGAAKTGNQLTVKQLDAYLQTAVPEITEKYKGTPQYPASFSYGNDFPIYIFK